jgi:hypothetical protein
VSLHRSTATSLGQPAMPLNLRPRPGEQRESAGPALYQPGPEPQGIGYTFVAMPPIAFELCRQGKLQWSDLGTLEALIGYQNHVPGSCWTTIRAMAERMESNGNSLESNDRAVQRSLKRMFGVGLVGRRVVASPDPQEPANRTGYRYDFLWANDLMTPRILGEERLAEGRGDTHVTQRLGDTYVRQGVTPMSESPDTGVTQHRLNKLDRKKSSSLNSRTRENDDDDFLNSEEKDAPTPQGDSEIVGQGPIEPQPLAVPAPVDHHAAKGSPAAPAVRGGVPATEVDQDTAVHVGTPPRAKGLPADSQDSSPAPAAANPSAPIPDDIIAKIRTELGDTIANKVAGNPAMVRDASGSSRDVLDAATKKMKPYVKTKNNPFGYYLTLMRELAKDGIPKEFAKPPAVVYFKATPRTEEEEKENAELKREAVKKIREMVAAKMAMDASGDDIAAKRAADRKAGEDWYQKKQRRPIENWPKAVLADPIIASDPVVANVVGRGDAPDQRTESPQEASLAEAV